MRVLIWLGGLKLTLAIFFLLGFSVMAAYFSEVRTSPWLVFSLLALAVNLLAAIISKPHFRRQAPLLWFHLALLTLIILVAVGRLTFLRGQAEVIEGTEFSGQLIKADQGPWHAGDLSAVRFVNHGFRIAYAPGLTRLDTQNLVSWTDAEGRRQEQRIGDHVPLVLNGFRFYTTSNKGFALLFEWRPKNGSPRVGSVNLPSYPANSLKQAQRWALPGVEAPVWAMLQFEGELIPTEAAGEFRLPEDHQVVVRVGEQRWQLPEATTEAVAEGRTTVRLAEGELVYLGLRSWMGYLVTYDRTLPWLLAAAVFAVLALGWHFWRKFSSRPWDA